MEEVRSLNPPPVSVDVCDIESHEDKREKRQLRFWIIRVMVLCFAFCFTSVVFSMSYVFIVRGDVWHEGLLGQLIKAWVEIIKFMMTEA